MILYFIYILTCIAQVKNFDDFFDIDAEIKNLPINYQLSENQNKTIFNNNIYTAKHNNAFSQKNNVKHIDQNNDNEFYTDDVSVIINNHAKEPVETRRASVLKWFKKILVTTPSTITVPDQETAENNRTNVELTKVLLKLTAALDNINNYLEKNDKDKFILVKMANQNYRHRRDTDNINVTVVTGNDTVTNNETVNNVNNTVITGRRSMSFPSAVFPETEIKKKLLLYLEESFAEIEKKIQPLDAVKIMLSNDNNYKIGYIIANLDTLNVNLNKLKADMDANKHFWDDWKILDLYDKLKRANNVVSNLLEAVKLHLHKF